MTDRDRAWDAEHHRAALQIITEADRGLKVAEHQLKVGRLLDARETVRIVRGLLPPLERAIQRRPVRAEVERLTAPIEAVRKLHREVTIEEFDFECVLGMCGHKRQCPPLVAKGCAHCGVGVYPYPCPTIRALDATPETGGES